MSEVLPKLTAAEKNLSLQLQHIIVLKIQADGPVSFAEFMQQALYHPEFGYYRNGMVKFGAEGDFVTASERSPLYSWCVARHCLPVLRAYESPVFFEFGAGSGQFALDFLLYLQRNSEKLVDYHILECSAELQQRQYNLFKRSAPQLLPYVKWVTELPAEPIEGVVFANEILDAMPVHVFFKDRKSGERYVDWDGDAFVWCDGAYSSHSVGAAVSVVAPEQNEQRYESEINLHVAGWLKSVAKMLKQGLVLLVDYGYSRAEYYSPVRTCGTLMCHYRHRAHTNPLINVGVQDITAHVDFTAVAESAVAAHLDVLSYLDQGRFLVNCGIDTLLACDDVEQRYRLSQEAKHLILPTEMGERFKVLGLGKHCEIDLLGFSSGDQLYRL